MRRRYVILAVLGVAAGACANILGIDDGIPRSLDGSIDAVTNDVTTDVHDAGTDVVDAPFSPLSCGTSTCNFDNGEACCRTGASTYACIDAGGMCKGTLIPCDRPDQCKGGDAGPRECCTTDVLTDSGAYVATSVGCMTLAQCLPIPTHYRLCGDGDAGDCPDGTTCGASVSTLPSFLICK
jgi:hypothetical protein